MPLLIYPEGGTTCGKLMMFKKGGFLAETPIKPLGYKYHAPCVSPKTGIIDGFKFYMV